MSTKRVAPRGWRSGRRAAGTLAILCLVLGNPATATPFEATLGVHVLGATPAFFTGSGQGTSTGALVTVPGDLFSGTELLMLTANQAPPLSGVRLRVSGNGAGAFSGTPLVGPLPVGGHLDLLGFGVVILQVPFATGGAGIGIGGVHKLPLGGSIDLTLQFDDWATGIYTSLGGAVFQGLDSRTPGGLGQLSLVSPTRVDLSVPSSTFSFSVVSTLTLQFVPEPATLLLLGAGVAALAWQGRRQARR